MIGLLAAFQHIFPQIGIIGDELFPVIQTPGNRDILQRDKSIWKTALRIREDHPVKSPGCPPECNLGVYPACSQVPRYSRPSEQKDVADCKDFIKNRSYPSGSSAKTCSRFHQTVYTISHFYPQCEFLGNPLINAVRMTTV